MQYVGDKGMIICFTITRNPDWFVLLGALVYFRFNHYILDVFCVMNPSLAEKNINMQTLSLKDRE